MIKPSTIKYQLKYNASSHITCVFAVPGTVINMMHTLSDSYNNSKGDIIIPSLQTVETWASRLPSHKAHLNTLFCQTPKSLFNYYMIFTTISGR